MRAATAAAALTFSAIAALGQTESQTLSPAQQRIAWAREAIAKSPGHYASYNDLALALARRARETADPSYYAQAEAALRKSFELAPGNFEGQKVRAWLYLGRHEFARALELAKELNGRVPDDIQVYAFLTDAHAELGNYREAEEACQWLLDMRPGSTAGLTRAAYLRELFGNISGAIELMNAAYDRTPASEREDRAWILTQRAHLELLTGKAEAAEKLLNQALEIFPGYHYALAKLAEVRTAQGKHAEAAELLRRRFQAAPHPENLYALAEALVRAGRRKEAGPAFSEFERKARAEAASPDNANRELVFYLIDYARKPAEALRIARLEASRRRDVYTLDAYAWALCANGRYAEARKQIEAALAVGVRDAKLWYHAGRIAAKLRDRTAAERYLKQSLELNPRSEISASARTELAGLARRRNALSGARR